MAKELLPEGSYIVAVSGGVDSVVLLDMLSKQSNLQLVVAHFDHGTRDDSAADLEFVRELAHRYGVKFEGKREELGLGVSEEVARNRRYAFLKEVAEKYAAKIVTAHHRDDMVETIAINIERGTGWRGLAVLDNPDIVRPILHLQKKQLLTYAHHHKLRWHEDSTNQSDAYLRNRLRRKISSQLPEDDSRLLVALRDQQVQYKRLIDEETSRLVGQPPYSRHFFIAIPQKTAAELLRALFIKETGASPMESQRLRALTAIKVNRPGASHDVGGGVRLQFTQTEFIVDTL